MSARKALAMVQTAPRRLEPRELPLPELGAEASVETDAEGQGGFEIDARPELWSPESPRRYEVVIESDHDSVSELVRSQCGPDGSLSTEAIFSCIDEIRKRADLTEDTVIVLLSRMRHEGNWFSLGEGNSHFMHADDWNLFTATSFRLPVTFLLASNIIMRGMYDTLQEIAYRAHEEARGCIMDLCMDKPDISLKMRTADACPECMARIRSRIRRRI